MYPYCNYKSPCYPHRGKQRQPLLVSPPAKLQLWAVNTPEEPLSRDCRFLVATWLHDCTFIAQFGEWRSVFPAWWHCLLCGLWGWVTALRDQLKEVKAALKKIINQGDNCVHHSYWSYMLQERAQNKCRKAPWWVWERQKKENERSQMEGSKNQSLYQWIAGALWPYLDVWEHLSHFERGFRSCQHFSRRLNSHWTEEQERTRARRVDQKKNLCCYELTVATLALSSSHVQSLKRERNVRGRAATLG